MTLIVPNSNDSMTIRLILEETNVHLRKDEDMKADDDPEGDALAEREFFAKDQLLDHMLVMQRIRKMQGSRQADSVNAQNSQCPLCRKQRIIDKEGQSEC